MVQLSSPRPERMPVPAGNKKQNALNRADRIEQSEFRRTLEKGTSQRRKETRRKSADEAPHKPAAEKNPPSEEGRPSPGEEKSPGRLLRDKASLSLKAGARKKLRPSGGTPENHEKAPLRREACKKAIPSEQEILTVRREEAPRLSEEAPAPPPEAPSVHTPVLLGAAVEPSLSEKGAPAPAGQKGGKVPEGKAAPERRTLGAETLEKEPPLNLKEELPAPPDKADRPLGEARKNGIFQAAALRKAKGEKGPSVTLEDRRTVKSARAKAVFTPLREANPDGMTLEMASPEEAGGAIPPVEGAAPSGGAGELARYSAEEQKGALLLNKQLEEGGTRDLAKNIRFVLKDRDRGEIKLILKPEALGKVRIQLNLQENNIVGKIFVENNSVKQVFLDQLPDLAKALEESGFETSSLDVSVGGGGAERQGSRHRETPLYFHREAADLEDQIPVVFEEASALSQINLVI